MQKKVMITQPIHPDAIERLEEEVEVVLPDSTEERTVKETIKDVDGAIPKTFSANSLAFKVKRHW